MNRIYRLVYQSIQFLFFLSSPLSKYKINLFAFGKIAAYSEAQPRVLVIAKYLIYIPETIVATVARLASDADFAKIQI